MTKKTDTEALKKAIRTEMGNAVGRSGETLSNARTSLKSAYLGEALAGDKARRECGWSTYQDRSLLETVEWAKPSLLRVFAASDEIVRFDPNRPDQEQAAEDATDYVNKVVFGGNAFGMIYDIVSDALLQRVAWGKVYFERAESLDVREFSGLSRDEALATVLKYGPEAVEVEAEQSQKDGQEPVYRVKVTLRRDKSAVKVVSLPSERVLWNEDALDIENARFVAHWEDRTIASLRAEGYDEALLEELSTEDDRYPETQVQDAVNSDGAVDFEARPGSMRQVRVYEAYILMPAGKGQGVQRWRVEYVGEAQTILKAEPWTMPRPPLFPVSSVPLSHQPAGLCLADLVMDIQLLRTELSRQLLDSLALSNQGEFIVQRRSRSDEIDMDQFLSRRVAGVYELFGDTTVFPLPTDSRAASEAGAALGLTDKVKEMRTGIGQQIQGMSADALQNTAAGAIIAEDAVNQRVELIARILAEMYFKPVAKYVLLLVSRYQNKPMQARVKGRFFQWSPAEWDPEMDVQAAVGLGTGNRGRQSGSLQAVIGLQAQIMKSLGTISPVKVSHVMHACHKLAQSMGFSAPEQFFGSMEDAKKADEAQANQPPQPSPEEQKIQLEQQKAQADIQLDREKAMANIMLERAKLAANAQLKAEQIKADQQLDAMQIALGQKGPGVGVVPGATV